MVKNTFSNYLSPARKGILAGLLLALLVTIVSHGVFNAMYVIPEPNYDLPDLPAANGWDFSSGLSLSAQIQDQADRLVSFFIAPGSSDDYFYGTEIIWGTIQPDTFPTIYTFPLDNNDYDIGFNVQTTSIWYDNVHTVVHPDELYLLNHGLIHLLASEEAFTTVTYEEYLAGIHDYFESQPDYPYAEDGLRIEHTYSDGTMFLFRVLDDTVFVQFGSVDQLAFYDHGNGLHSISNEFNETESEFYTISINDFNLQAYADNVNYLWYSLGEEA